LRIVVDKTLIFVYRGA